MWIEVPPFLPFFLGALLLVLAPRGWPRGVVLLGIPILGGLNLIGAHSATPIELEVFHYTLTPFRVTGISLLFGYLFHIAAFIGNLFALHLKREDDDTLQHAAALLYAGSALGAVFAGDFITLFVFWELLALTSAFLIWARGTARSVRAGFRYLIIQVVSGVLLLAGALILAHETGDRLRDTVIDVRRMVDWLSVQPQIDAVFANHLVDDRRLRRRHDVVPVGIFPRQDGDLHAARVQHLGELDTNQAAPDNDAVLDVR